MDLQAIGDGVMGFFTQLGAFLAPLAGWLEGIPGSFSQMDGVYGTFYATLSRYGCPMVAFLLLLRCADREGALAHS